VRASIFTALAAAVAALLVTAGAAQVSRRTDAHAFSAARLAALPTTSWPTNGGDVYNRRYSPLTAINRGNVARLTGVWRARLAGSGTSPQYSGFAQPLVHDGVAYVSTGANDVFALSIETGRILWQYEARVDPGITSVCCGWNNKGVAISEDKVFIGHLDGDFSQLGFELHWTSAALGGLFGLCAAFAAGLAT
jgi:glucose dehydrogenase